MSTLTVFVFNTALVFNTLIVFVFNTALVFNTLIVFVFNTALVFNTLIVFAFKKLLFTQFALINRKFCSLEVMELPIFHPRETRIKNWGEG
jgi:hypothetical protein